MENRGVGVEPQTEGLAQAWKTLDLLGMFYYILGSFSALCSLLPIFHVVLGGFILFSPEVQRKGELPPQVFGAAFFFGGLAFIGLGLAYSALLLYAGRCLKARRRQQWVQVAAAICCLHVPVGTLLGVYTLVELHKDSIRAAFQDEN